MANTGKQKDERTLRYIDNFMEKHNEGHTVPEIAKMYGISKRHGYLLLQEIADKNNVERAELLKQPHKQHSTPLFIHTRDGDEKVNAAEINEKLNKLLSATREVLTAYEKILEEDEHE